MNTTPPNELMLAQLKHVMSSLIPFDPPTPGGDLPQGALTSGAWDDDSDSVFLVKTAVVAKYGANARESAFKFVEEAEAILKKYGVDAAAPAPTLSTKLDALKAEIGDSAYAGMLSNPNIENLAARAYRRSVTV